MIFRSFPVPPLGCNCSIIGDSTSKQAIVVDPGGVLARRGHTEGTVDLAILAGLKPAGVLCELMNADGTMTRGADVERFAAKHNLPMLTIAELAEFRLALTQARECVEEA